MKQHFIQGLMMLAGMALLTPACAKKRPPPPHPLDMIYGFRDARFGLAPNMIQGLDMIKPIVKPTPALDYAVYRRLNENLRINNVSLDEIRYAFFRKQLTEITMLWEPEDRSDPSMPPAIYHVLTNQFGPPLQNNVDAVRREFQANWETALVRLTLIETRGQNDERNKGRGTVTLYSKPLVAQLRAVITAPDSRSRPGF